MSAEMNAAEARELLGIDDAASADEIHAAHTRLVRENHPDVGGTSGLAKLINQAHDVALDAIRPMQLVPRSALEVARLELDRAKATHVKDEAVRTAVTRHVSRKRSDGRWQAATAGGGAIAMTAVAIVQAAHAQLSPDVYGWSIFLAGSVLAGFGFFSARSNLEAAWHEWQIAELTRQLEDKDKLLDVLYEVLDATAHAWETVTADDRLVWTTYAMVSAIDEWAEAAARSWLSRDPSPRAIAKQLGGEDTARILLAASQEHDAVKRVDYIDERERSRSGCRLLVPWNAPRALPAEQEPVDTPSESEQRPSGRPETRRPAEERPDGREAPPG